MLYFRSDEEVKIIEEARVSAHTKMSFWKKFRRKSSYQLSERKSTSTVIEISTPTEFSHDFHVEIGTTGKLSGMPEAWQAWLDNSQIRSLCLDVLS